MSPFRLAIRLAIWVTGIVLAVPVVPALAQVQLPPQSSPSVIGPGTLRGSSVPQLPARPDGPLVEGEGIQTPSVQGNGTATFLLQSLEIPSSHFLLEEELAEVAGRWVGREVGFADLQVIVDEINALYREKGIGTASAVLPPQRIENGTVRLQLVEGRLSGVEVEGNAYTGSDYFRDRIAGAEGDILDSAAMHRRLLRFNLTNSAQVRAALRPGQSFGLTDVVLAVVEPPRNALDVAIDNHGFETTGRLQGSAFGRTNSLVADGDRITAAGSRSRGTSTFNASYNLPVGPWDGRVGVGGTFSRTTIIQGDFRDLDVEGTSRAINANVSQPVWTGDRAMVSVIGSVQRSLSVNTIAKITTSRVTVTKGQAGLSAYWGGETTSVMATQSVGSVYASNDLDGAGRRMVVWNGTLSAQQHLTGPLSARINGAWQYTPATALPGDQLFQLGGATTLRGLPPGAMVGDSGAFAQVELHADASPLIDGLDLFAFYDTGVTEYTDRDSTVMGSMGLGLSWRLGSWATAEATYARRLRDIRGTELEDNRMFLRAVFHLL